MKIALLIAIAVATLCLPAYLITASLTSREKTLKKAKK